MSRRKEAPTVGAFGEPPAQTQEKESRRPSDERHECRCRAPGCKCKHSTTQLADLCWLCTEGTHCKGQAFLDEIWERHVLAGTTVDRHR